MPVPLGVSNGLPVAVQIYADRWREDLCFEAAAQRKRRWDADPHRPKGLKFIRRRREWDPASV